MSAADRMVVRTSAGVRSLPRREALAMISTRRAKLIPPRSPQSGAVRVVTADAPQLAPVSSLVDEMPTGPRGGVKFEPNPDPDPTSLPIVAPAVEQPKGNAGRDAWVEYARVHGVEVTEDMGRNEVRDTVLAKLENDRMSRPAFEGGRPATPEDEPVTESAVTDADPGERTA